MIKSKSDQLCKNVVPFLSARVPKAHLSGHYLEGDPAKPARYPDTDVAGVRILEPPSRGQDAKVLVAPDQVVGNHEDRTTQVAVGATHQRTVGVIDLVALIPRRIQAGSPANRSGLDIVLDRSHLAREFGRRDDVDAGDTQKQNVGGLTQDLRQFTLDRTDHLQLRQAIVIEVSKESAMK